VVSVTEKDDVSLVEIKVASDDRGRVIGKEGHTIKSLRALIDVTVAPQGKKASLELSR
jgi:predicted RNA-binding protein YlqC (UPF0109 family)